MVPTANTYEKCKCDKSFAYNFKYSFKAVKFYVNLRYFP